MISLISGRRDEGPAALGVLFFGALRLDPATYGRVARDPSLTRLCIAVVMLTGVVQGGVWDVPLAAGVRFLLGALLGLSHLLADACIVWVFGTGLMSRRVQFGAVLRPLAIAAAPGMIKALVPYLKDLTTPTLVGLASLVAWVWLIAAFVVAIRAALGTRLPFAVLIALLNAAARLGIEALSHR